MITIQRTNYRGLQVHKHCPWNVFPRASLAEESVEGVITNTNGLVRWHLAIRLNAMLKAVKLPACITHLHASLPHMD